MAIDVPELVRQRALSNGPNGQRWLDELPQVVATLCDQWDLQVGATFSAGTSGYVAKATKSDGQACVVKVAMPLDESEARLFERSVRVHKLAAGRGCARLLASDASAHAVLLERLGQNLAELGLPLPQLLESIVGTLASFWSIEAADTNLPSGAEKAAWLRNDIVTSWEQLGQPCTRNVVDRAVAYCDERASAFDRDKAVLVHGDAHGWNTLDAGNGQFKFVDPEGWLSERAHDLGVAMREYNEPLLDGDTATLARGRAEYLAAACDVDVDAEAVWQWGFVERVSTGLANVRDFDDGSGEQFLEVAEHCL